MGAYRYASRHSTITSIIMIDLNQDIQLVRDSLVKVTHSKDLYLAVSVRSMYRTHIPSLKLEC